MRRRGLGLGTTLVVVALVATLGFIVTSASVSHLQVMSRGENQAYAQDLARSALSLALERVLNDRTFGTREDQDRTLEVELPGAPPGSRGVLSFDPGQSDVPVSINNLDGAESVTDDNGQVIPSQGVLFVAEGRCRGVVRRVEAVLHVPPFPYAAASDGPVISSGGLEVGSLDEDTPPGTPVAELKPATLLSNSTSPQAIVLGPNSTIKGDLMASGGIEIDEGGTIVIGELLTNQDPRPVPRIQAADYDPGENAVALEGTYNQADFTGRLKRQGNLEINEDLRLQGALLYVDGDLTVHGSLTGSGIVVTTGSTRIEGQAEMQGSDKVALISMGRLELLGKGRASSNLRGVVYTEGGVTARQLRLEGALVARLDQEVQLQDASMLRDRSASRVEVELPRGLVPGRRMAFHMSPDGEILSRDRNPNPRPPSYFYGRLVTRPDGRVDWYACEHCNGQKIREVEGTADLQDVSQPGHPWIDTFRGELSPTQYQAFLDELYAPAGEGEEQPEATIETVDPSRLLPLADSARIVLWRER